MQNVRAKVFNRRSELTRLNDEYYESFRPGGDKKGSYARLIEICQIELDKARTIGDVEFVIYNCPSDSDIKNQATEYLQSLIKQRDDLKLIESTNDVKELYELSRKFKKESLEYTSSIEKLEKVCYEILSVEKDILVILETAPFCPRGSIAEDLAMEKFRSYFSVKLSKGQVAVDHVIKEFYRIFMDSGRLIHPNEELIGTKRFKALNELCVVLLCKTEIFKEIWEISIFCPNFSDAQHLAFTKLNQTGNNILSRLKLPKTITEVRQIKDECIVEYGDNMSAIKSKIDDMQVEQLEKLESAEEINHFASLEEYSSEVMMKITEKLTSLKQLN